MEKIESLQEKIDKTEYWDMKILDFQINFLGDEVSMWIYNDAIQVGGYHFYPVIK